MSWEFQAEAQVLEGLSRQFVFPDNYVVADVETSGFYRSRDVIIDAGFALVKNSQVTQSYSRLLNWSLMPNVDHAFIRSQLLRQADDYAKIGRPHYYPWERLCDEGGHPVEVLHEYVTALYSHIIDKDSMVVGHAFFRFDREVIDSHTQRFMQGYLLPWKMNTIFDTGLLEKAAQTNMVPYETDTLDEWQRRVNNASAKVKWNLEFHCVPKYRLIERYNADMRLMHTAGFDCVLIHYLLQPYRQLTEILNGQRQCLEGSHAA